MQKLDAKIHNTDWDTLVVFDACRYDYLHDEYDNFPYVRNGSVEKVMSPGSATEESAPRMFPGEYDFNLYSANKLVYTNGIIDDWDPEETFNRVIEIESSTHNETRFTPSPQDEITFVQEKKKEINEHKSVLWMMQPHTPYFGDVQLNISSYQMDDDKLKDSSFKHLIRESYRGNVRQALWIATSLLGMLDGKIAITSDHGELLFDKTIRMGSEKYGHYPNSSHSKLRNIPWIEMEADEYESIHDIDAEKFVEMAFDCVFGRELDEDARNCFPETLRMHERGEVTDRMPYCRKDMIPMLRKSDEYKEKFESPENDEANIPAKQLEELGYL
jgi:hypothetical protein